MMRRYCGVFDNLKFANFLALFWAGLHATVCPFLLLFVCFAEICASSLSVLDDDIAIPTPVCQDEQVCDSENLHDSHAMLSFEQRTAFSERFHSQQAILMHLQANANIFCDEEDLLKLPGVRGNAQMILSYVVDLIFENNRVEYDPTGKRYRLLVDALPLPVAKGPARAAFLRFCAEEPRFVDLDVAQQTYLL